MLAQMERMKQGAYQACLAEVESHLKAFLSRSPVGSYEQWIGELHPENVRMGGGVGERSVDHRLYNEGSVHLRLWNSHVERRRSVCAWTPDTAASRPCTPPPPHQPPIARPFPTLAPPLPTAPGAPTVPNLFSGLAGLASGRPGTAGPTPPSGRSPCAGYRSLSQPALPGRPKGVSSWPCSMGTGSPQTGGDCSFFAPRFQEVSRLDLPPTFHSCAQPGIRLPCPAWDAGTWLPPPPPSELVARVPPTVGPDRFLQPPGASFTGGGVQQHQRLCCFPPSDAGAWRSPQIDELVLQVPPGSEACFPHLPMVLPSRPARWSLPGPVQWPSCPPVQTPVYTAPHLMRVVGSTSSPPWPLMQPQTQPAVHCARWTVPQLQPLFVQ